MSTNFPSLLRRTSFATYDPLLTRVYTSPNPTSGDFGLKYTHPLPKGPRYIKVASLDAGKAVNTDYSSGEREARWMAAWGSGRVRISPPKEGTGYPKPTANPFTHEMFGTGASRSNSKGKGRDEGVDLAGKATIKSDAVERMWMENVESMSPKEFERYLETIRASRSGWLQTKLQSLSSSSKPPKSETTSTSTSSTSFPGDKTLVHLNISGQAAHLDSANLQTDLTRATITDPTSARLVGTPHPVHGLSYGSGPATPSSIDGGMRSRSAGYTPPEFAIPGRVVDVKVTSPQDERRAAVTSQYDINHTYVVSAGGHTGEMKRLKSMSDLEGSPLSQMDYTRARSELGHGTFTVSAAELKRPPMVLGLKDSDAANRWTTDFLERKSMAKRAKPFDTMHLDITFDPLPPSTTDAPPAGSAGWVQGSGDPRKSSATTREDELARQSLPSFVGGPRKDRQRPGRTTLDAHRQISSKYNERQEGQRTMDRTRARLDDILGRNKDKPRFPRGEARDR